jgi:DNA mismatch repair protein MLH1
MGKGMGKGKQKVVEDPGLKPDGDADEDIHGEEEEGGERQEEEDPDLALRRHKLRRAVEYKLFPACKARLVATRGLLKGVVEVANLKGLYRVFERC